MSQGMIQWCTVDAVNVFIGPTMLIGRCNLALLSACLIAFLRYICAIECDRIDC